MVNHDTLLAKTNNIQNCLQRIHDTIANNTQQLDDLDAQDIVVLNLQRAIQTAIDMAAHVIASEQLGLPTTLKDHFIILHHNQIIDANLSDKMTRMVGFRNIACHDYQAINLDILKAIVTHHLTDLEEYYTQLLKKFDQSSS